MEAIPDGITSTSIRCAHSPAFAAHTETLKAALAGVVAALGDDRDCTCSHTVDGMDLPIDLPDTDGQ